MWRDSWQHSRQASQVGGGLGGASSGGSVVLWLHSVGAGASGMVVLSDAGTCYACVVCADAVRLDRVLCCQQATTHALLAHTDQWHQKAVACMHPHTVTRVYVYHIPLQVLSWPTW
jgi:hypothetical protein